jgi:hypothetical protein
MALHDFHTNRLLLDTVAETKFGGTRTPFQWNWAHGLIVANKDREIILPGDLNSKTKIFVGFAILLVAASLRLTVRDRLFRARKQHSKAGLLPALTPIALTTIALLPWQLSLIN